MRTCDILQLCLEKATRSQPQHIPIPLRSSGGAARSCISNCDLCFVCGKNTIWLDTSWVIFCFNYKFQKNCGRKFFWSTKKYTHSSHLAKAKPFYYDLFVTHKLQTMDATHKFQIMKALIRHINKIVTHINRNTTHACVCFGETCRIIQRIEVASSNVWHVECHEGVIFF